uniref:(northern house mosquito) hypothetical protein n=1 Tax=Culex pipiens TaxID=7175 RepID=A0A8D8CPC1_CULPI
MLVVVQIVAFGRQQLAGCGRIRRGHRAPPEDPPQVPQRVEALAAGCAGVTGLLAGGNLLVMLMVVLKMLQMFRGGDGDWHVVRVQHHAAVTRACHGSRGSSTAAATVTDAIAAGCRGTLQRG